MSIISKPLSEQGRENHDAIFRKNQERQHGKPLYTPDSTMTAEKLAQLNGDVLALHRPDRQTYRCPYCDGIHHIEQGCPFTQKKSDELHATI